MVRNMKKRACVERERSLTPEPVGRGAKKTAMVSDAGKTVRGKVKETRHRPNMSPTAAPEKTNQPTTSESRQVVFVTGGVNEATTQLGRTLVGRPRENREDLHAEITGLCDIWRRSTAELAGKNKELDDLRKTIANLQEMVKQGRAAMEVKDRELEELRVENQHLQDLREQDTLIMETKGLDLAGLRIKNEVLQSDAQRDKQCLWKATAQLDISGSSQI